jgi:tetratricopeptide (TPR) repeat protein
VAPDELEAAVDRAALAAILEARGRNREALETLREVLTTLESLLGADHYEVGLTLSDLGAMHMSAGRFAEADDTLTRAALILERVLGASHPTAAACRAQRDQARARRNGRSG